MKNYAKKSENFGQLKTVSRLAAIGLVAIQIGTSMAVAVPVAKIRGPLELVDRRPQVKDLVAKAKHLVEKHGRDELDNRNDIVPNESFRISAGVPRMEELAVAMVQYEVKYNLSEAEFLQRFAEYVIQSSANYSDLIMFPELFSLDLLKTPGQPGGNVSYEAQTKEIAEKLTPKLIKLAVRLSAKYQRAILAGTSPRINEKGQVVNTAILVFPNGQVVFQDKMFRTHDEKEWNWTPGETINVVDTPWGRTAILTCFDVQFPILSEALRHENVELILVPSMTEYAGWHRVSRGAQARTQEHHALSLHLGTVGSSAIGDGGFGGAAIYFPADRKFPDPYVANGPLNVPAIVDYTLDLKTLRASKERTRTYPAREEAERLAPINVAGPEGNDNKFYDPNRKNKVEIEIGNVDEKLADDERDRLNLPR